MLTLLLRQEGRQHLRAERKRRLGISRSVMPTKSRQRRMLLILRRAWWRSAKLLRRSILQCALLRSARLPISSPVSSLTDWPMSSNGSRRMLRDWTLHRATANRVWVRDCRAERMLCT